MNGFQVNGTLIGSIQIFNNIFNEDALFIQIGLELLIINEGNYF